MDEAAAALKKGTYLFFSISMHVFLSFEPAGLFVVEFVRVCGCGVGV